MAHGLRVYDSSGVLTLDISSLLTRQIYERDLPAGETSSVSIADFNSANCIAMAIPTDPATKDLMGHVISTSGTTITWTSVGALGTPCKLVVFKYR
jgi:hypothetical protein